MLFVYIAEAHASDTWPMAYSVQWPRPTCLEQRLAYAQTMAADLQMRPAFHVVVDSMDDAFNDKFKAWPQGIYVAQAGKLVYSSESGGDSPGYDVQELFDFWRTL